MHKELYPERNISILLDTYDDLFSDFDPRHLSERSLSDDFTAEIRKFCREKEERVHELKLLLPPAMRNHEQETIILQRLHEYFKRNDALNLSNYKKLLKRGILFTLSGIITMLLASYISSIHSKTFLLSVLFVIFEPAGWFLVWTGFDTFLFSSTKAKKELTFYGKLSKSKISFNSITD